MDICDPTEIFRCGHCSKVLGTINDIIEHDLCAKHSCFAYHDNIEIDPESKLVLVKKLPLTIPKEVLISHTAGPSTSTSKPLGETRGGTGGSQMN
ncbi:unnamed protein product [Phaedon cochleariae]|uniref:C2H2-type domain-containing protein n=1 Tax=Phaedon cochleariae TaxID=80249 RepID=A0A9N9SFY8_PHACE|nr:unnamed protein product [Phaedon cochleariae]